MAQFITKKRNEMAATSRQDRFAYSVRDYDIQVYLHNLWLARMATSQLYDDAKTVYGHCRCCSRVLPEGRK